MNPRIRPVVVLFHPGESDIASLLELARRGWHPVVVSNGADAGQLETLRAAGIDLIDNAANLGLAHALNQGIAQVFASGASYVMLLDQDTRPPATLMDELLSRAEGFGAGGGKLACIGPRPVDRKAAEGVVPTTAALRSVQTIITSGKLIPRSAFEQIGGMWNELFIDYIDHEWCFRARAHGFDVLMAEDVAMPHDLGDAAVGPRGHERILHRSPVRHYHLIRNALWMRHCAHVPRGWRLAELARLAYRIPTFLAASTDRARSLSEIRRGLRDGLAGPWSRSYSAASAGASDG